MDSHVDSRAVLVVDDDDSVRRVVARILERAGFSVLEARNGAEALRMDSGADAGIQLLLTDVRMPGMPGDELAGHFSQRHPRSAVLLMSGYTDVNLGNGYKLLAKPFRPAELLAAVAEALAANNSGHPGPAALSG